MKLVVATDIFGITTELVEWLRPIAESLNLELELVSPYPATVASTMEGQLAPVVPSSEEHAYQNFLKHGGLELYSKKLQHCFESQSQAFSALGFSAGAAAIWRVAATSSSSIKQAFCFYGGQIRLNSDLQPQVPTTLIWAQESHFDVDALHQQLRQYPYMNSIVTTYAHGFINPLSAGFHQEAASHYQHLLIEMLMLGAE